MRHGRVRPPAGRSRFCLVPSGFSKRTSSETNWLVVAQETTPLLVLPTAASEVSGSFEYKNPHYPPSPIRPKVYADLRTRDCIRFRVACGILRTFSNYRRRCQIVWVSYASVTYHTNGTGPQNVLDSESRVQLITKDSISELRCGS